MASPQDLPPSLEAHGTGAPPNLLQILWGRKALIILGAVIGVTIGAIYYVQRKPQYETSAQILVDRKMPDFFAPGLDSSGFVDDYLATQEKIILSPIVVGLAVKDKERELSQLKSFQGMDERTIIETIRGSLKVNRETQQGGFTGPSTLTLTYRGPDPDDCATVLNAVIASYQKFLFDRYFKKDAKTTQALLDAQKSIDDQLVDLQKEHTKWLDEGPVIIGKDGITVQEEMLTSIQSQRSGLAIRQQELEAKLTGIEGAIKEGRDPALLIEALENKPLNSQANTFGSAATNDANIALQLMPQLLELNELEERFGPDYVGVRALRKRIAEATKLLRGTGSDFKSGAPSSISTTLERVLLDSGVGTLGLMAAPGEQGPLAAASMLLTNRSTTREVARYVLSIRLQLQQILLTENLLKTLADKESKEVHSLASFRNRDTLLRSQIASKNQQLESIAKLLNDRKTLGSPGGYEATVIAEPNPGIQIEPKPMPIFTAATLLGFLAGVALAWFAEASDKSFRTPDEVRRRLGLPVVGHVPRILPDPEAARQHEAGAITLDPSICAFYQSKSLEAESFRGIRTTLYFSAQNEGCKIIQVTSPNMGDGKTTVATNLAVSIAQSGKRILLIDADFRRPKLHRMFGVRAAVGLATVIQNDTELTDAIQSTPVPNLSLLPCGPRPSNPAELLTSPRFREVLETLRDKFDLILIDTPPLLAVSDPSVVATQVDGVLITIRVSKNGRPAAERARDILATLSANVLGVIVNGIGQRGQEGYGAAHYGYQYQYQYAYEPTDNRSYYQDGEAESQVHKNGTTSGNGHNGTHTAEAEPPDPDAVDVGTLPGSEAGRGRDRGAGSRHKPPSNKPGAFAGLKRWLRTSLWH